jgi:hypothetical protein
MASRCCVMLCVAMCSARIWQGLRSAVLFYVLRCYAMRCYAKPRARRCRCFSIPDDGWLSLNEYEQSAAVPRVHLEWRSSLYSWRRIHCRSDRTAKRCAAERNQARWGTQDGSGTCMIQPIAMCSARLCYAMLCDAMRRQGLGGALASALDVQAYRFTHCHSHSHSRNHRHSHSHSHSHRQPQS